MLCTITCGRVISASLIGYPFPTLAPWCASGGLTELSGYGDREGDRLRGTALVLVEGCHPPVARCDQVLVVTWVDQRSHGPDRLPPVRGREHVQDRHRAVA